MKRIVIVGASSGIGLTLAQTLASRGVRVGLAARRTKKLAALKEQYPQCVEYMSIDITHASAPQRLRELIEKTGGMDIYIHVAGIGYDNPDLDPAVEAIVTDTDTTGFARMVAAAYNYFRIRGKGGQIAAVTSVAATKGLATMAAYSASKAFDRHYLSALRQLSNQQGDRITITDIRPGWIRTELLPPDADYALTMDPDQAVRCILRAIVKRRSVAVVDWRWALLAGIWQLVPSCLWERIPFRYRLHPRG